MQRTIQLTLVCSAVFVATAQPAEQAFPIRSVPNLVGVVVFEASGVKTLLNMLPNSVPEPSTLALLGIGSVCMAFVGVRRRRKNKAA